ncbi:MAG TPA: S46 family peptidase [Bryobacteraceae bacterium]|nr:S46 family peptidase [Bryobacteraceae bacterium]
MGYLLLLLAVTTALHAEEGMWTFNNFPADYVKKKFGFAPTPQWLDNVRLSSVRLAEGCSASFVSPNGLVLTNHHCAASCIQELSTAEKDYSAKGFHAQTPAQELRCARQEANVLTEISDVTKQVAAATRGLADKAANDARKAVIARIEKECASSDALRCEVVSLYGGGIYDLYKYRRYQDVRLVFAPEFAIAFFGGDPDNFMFPRYDLDMSFLRIYDNNQPLKTTHFFPFSPAGAKEGELTFVSGHPGGTNRQHTIAMLETERDVDNPHKLLYLSEFRGLLTMFQTRGEEQRRISQDQLFSVENSLKAFKGQQQALLERSFFEKKRTAEADFQKKVQADPKLRAEYGKVWSDIEAADRKLRMHLYPYLYVEGPYGFRSVLHRHARRLLRMAEEYPKPNEKRLAEFADARKPQAKQAALSTAPIYPELEIETLTFSLTKLREVFSPDDPMIRNIFGKRSPREVATEAIQSTKLGDVAVRKTLLEGGSKAVESSTDPMIALARLVDPYARAIRKKYEDEVESALTQGSEKLAKARFAVYGTSLYPDATFTLRLTYGSVKGWSENGKAVSPFTYFAGAFERHTGRQPFALPQSWLDAKPKLRLRTPFNFSTTNDIIGGNSGSPVINKEGQLVGLIFDGNIHSLGGNYGFDDQLNRAVAVHSAGILEALEKIYEAKNILTEIKAK